MQLNETERHNLKYGICKDKLVVEDTVFLHNVTKSKAMSQKLAFK